MSVKNTMPKAIAAFWNRDNRPDGYSYLSTEEYSRICFERDLWLLEPVTVSDGLYTVIKKSGIVHATVSGGTFDDKAELQAHRDEIMRLVAPLFAKLKAGSLLPHETQTPPVSERGLVHPDLLLALLQ